MAADCLGMDGSPAFYLLTSDNRQMQKLATLSNSQHSNTRNTPIASAAYLAETPEGVILNVRAQPRSSKSGIDGLLGDALKVRIRCAPVDGKANKELVETLADAFGISKSSVVFKGGETSKTKRLLLRGVTAERVKAVCNLV